MQEERTKKGDAAAWVFGSLVFVVIVWIILMTVLIEPVHKELTTGCAETTQQP